MITYHSCFSPVVFRILPVCFLPFVKVPNQREVATKYRERLAKSGRMSRDDGETQKESIWLD